MVHWAPRFGRIFQLALCASLAPLAAHADTDACTLVTAAQVSAAVHVAVGEGTHMMATFVKTCTWTPTASSSIKAVTVKVQIAAYYDGAKKMADSPAAVAAAYYEGTHRPRKLRASLLSGFSRPAAPATQLRDEGGGNRTLLGHSPVSALVA